MSESIVQEDRFGNTWTLNRVLEVDDHGLYAMEDYTKMPSLREQYLSIVMSYAKIGLSDVDLVEYFKAVDRVVADCDATGDKEERSRKLTDLKRLMIRQFDFGFNKRNMLSMAAVLVVAVRPDGVEEKVWSPTDSWQTLKMDLVTRDAETEGFFLSWAAEVLAGSVDTYRNLSRDTLMEWIKKEAALRAMSSATSIADE